MKKIPSLFARDAAGVITREYNLPHVDWVLRGEGSATRKFDGTAVRWANGQLWARFDAKRGKPLPPGFEPCQEPDPITGHHPGWVPATRPEDKWIREAAGDKTWGDGTYEACGPKIGRNAEGLETHVLIPHGHADFTTFDREGHGSTSTVPIGFDELKEWLTGRGIEGVVWWRDRDDIDCAKVKITASALGTRR